LPAYGIAPIWTEATAPFRRRPLTRILSGEVTSSQVLVPVSSHCFAWVATTADSSAKSPATNRIAGVAVGDGQRIGAELGVALPGAVRRPRQHPVAQQRNVHRHHLADIAGGDQLL